MYQLALPIKKPIIIMITTTNNKFTAMCWFGKLTVYSTYPGLVDHVDNGDETSLQGTSRAFRNATSLYKSLEGLQKKNKQKNKNLLEFLYDHGKNNCVFTF